MKILVLDNYDSFTYNLVHILRDLGMKLAVFRNDRIALEEVQSYDKILLSPGPGLPSQGGVMSEILKNYAQSKSILGVCLGHQAIGENFGARLHNLSAVFHGMVTSIDVVEDDPIFSKIPKSFDVCRYHSWVIEDKKLPKDLVVTTRDAEGTIMSVKHRSLDVRGVQFHPESIMTEYGIQIMKNWIEI